MTELLKGRTTVTTTGSQKRKNSFLQINAGRAMKTVAETRSIVDLQKIQVVAVQEPYTVKGRVASLDPWRG